MIINSKKTSNSYKNSLKNRSETNLFLEYKKTCNPKKNQYLIMGY